MLNSNSTFINEEFYAEVISGTELDELLANGWRHFERIFFGIIWVFAISKCVRLSR